MEHAHRVGEGADRTDLAALSRKIMRRQARLGLSVAVVFVLILVGLPLLNYFVPETMATGIGGFTFTWFFLALLFYPVTWLLSWLFVRGSDRIEAKLVVELRGAGLQSLIGGSSPVLAEPTPVNEPPAPAKRKLFVEEDEA